MDIENKLRQARERFNRVLIDPKSSALQRSYEEGYLNAVEEMYDETKKEQEKS